MRRHVTNLSVALLLSLALGAWGCSGSSDDGGAGGDVAGQDTSDPPLVGVDVPDTWSGADTAGPADGLSDALADVASIEDVDTPPEDVPRRPDVKRGDFVEEFEYPCEPLAEEACVTACDSAGRRTCLKDWGPCIPPAEFCGNCVDDDCDGEINEDCPLNPECEPIVPECPVAIIDVREGLVAWVGDELHLSAERSTAPEGQIARWAWSVQTPAGAAGQFLPSDDIEEPSFLVDAAGQFLFTLEVWDDQDNENCFPAQVAVTVNPFPPVEPEVGCADGAREGFLDSDFYTQIAGCAGAWDNPGITPDSVAPTCGRRGGDDGDFPEGFGCSSADLCAEGWHVCVGWQEVAEMSPTGCAGSVPPYAANKSLFFAIRQPSENYSECGEWGDGFNDIFGCGNLGHGLAADKNCGPLDRALASTQPNTCGFNEAEPNLGPWECFPPDGFTDPSHLNEGAIVTKKGCPSTSCRYDGVPLGNSDKGGVLCCRD